MVYWNYEIFCDIVTNMVRRRAVSEYFKGSQSVKNYYIMINVLLFPLVHNFNTLKTYKIV